MLRATHIRTKLGLALTVPLVGLVVMAGVEVAAAVRTVDATRSETALATASARAAALVGALQNERHLAVVELAGLPPAVDVPADARDRVDAAATALRAAGAGDGTVAAVHAPVIKAVGDLDALRSEIDGLAAAATGADLEVAADVFSRYAALIDQVHAATEAARVEMEHADLRAGVAVVHLASQQTEVRSRMAWTATLTTLDPADPARALRSVASLHDRAATLDAELRANATGHHAAAVEALEPAPFDDEIDTLLADGSARRAVVLSGMPPAPDAGYGALLEEAATILTADAQRAEDTALARQWGFGGLALALFVLAPLVTWLAARSITRPLAALRAQAEDMAGAHLPAAVRQILDTPFGEDVVIPKLEPITVTSHDEVADVAAALTAVQTSALDLAVEQAVLRRNISDSFINLGRRNQSLLGRQLDFITELERNESDPDTLEGLFRLDHLATRMRRNAESLLVLAGVEAPRQWAAPVKAGDVVRAALGEVEDYQRVVISHLEPATLTGAVVADIAHLTAELIENALSFSPDQQVEVKGRLTVDGYTIAISDNGLGMPPDELERANRRLAGAESFTVAPSRYLGHYVAGHLASRLGVRVELQSGATGGITARIDVPMGLVADDETDAHLNRLRGQKALDSLPDAAVEPPPPQPEPEPDPEPESSPAERVPAHLAASTAVETEPVATDAPADPPSLTTGGLPRRGDRSPSAPPVVAGFGGLAVTSVGPSLFTVTARNARRSADAPQQTTPTGLTRRVPGAQRPDLTVEPLRPRTRHRVPMSPAPMSPDDVYSFLNTFQSGVERGRTDALAEQATDLSTPEDER